MIEIKVNGSNIYCKNKDIVSGNGDDTAVFVFDKSWTGYAKTAVMFRVFGTQYSIPVQNNSCPVPSALLSGTGRLYIGVYGVSDGKTISTGFTSVEVFAGAAEGGVIEPPEAYAYTKLLEMISSAVSDGERFRAETLERLEEHSLACAEAESRRVGAEAVRDQSEQERIENEAGRVAAEAARSARENDALAAEEFRKTAESIREENEAARIKNSVTKDYLDEFIASRIGDVFDALDDLHKYAEGLKNGGGA